MLVHILHALPLIRKPERSKLRVAAVLASILVRRDRCECDPQRTSKTRDRSGHRVCRRVDDGDVILNISCVNARSVRRDGRKNWTVAKRDVTDDRVCARVDDKDLSEEWARHVKTRTVRSEEHTSEL